MRKIMLVGLLLSLVACSSEPRGKIPLSKWTTTKGYNTEKIRNNEAICRHWASRRVAKEYRKKGSHKSILMETRSLSGMMDRWEANRYIHTLTYQCMKAKGYILLEDTKKETKQQ